MATICLSVLDINMHNLDKSMNEIKNLGIKNIHIDVIDTSFCNNISFGISTINAMLDYDFIFEIHLMVNKPIEIIKKLNITKKTKITLHSDLLEAKRIFQENKNMDFGIAIDPEVPAESLFPILQFCNHALIMAVDPGKGGQSMKPETLTKIEKLRKFNIEIGVDGGVNSSTINLVRNFDYVVIGSAITKAKDKKDALFEISSNLNSKRK